MSYEIQKLFGAVQARLQADLQGGTLISHQGEKGNASEESWRKLLDDYLPRRFQVSKAFVVDSNGDISQQIDLVIYDRQYSILIFEQNGVLHVPAESVYAVFEVKQDLSLENIRYAGEKIASVRRLHRTSAPIVSNIGTNMGRPPYRIPGGILATRSSWNPALDSSLARALQGLSPEEQVDLGCAVQHGAFAATWDGVLKDVEVVGPDHALVWFFLRLIETLQKLGTAPAIDVGAYRRKVEEPRKLSL